MMYFFDYFWTHDTSTKSTNIEKKVEVHGFLFDFCLGFGHLSGFVQNQVQAMVPG